MSLPSSSPFSLLISVMLLSPPSVFHLNEKNLSSFSSSLRGVPSLQIHAASFVCIPESTQGFHTWDCDALEMGGTFAMT